MFSIFRLINIILSVRKNGCLERLTREKRNFLTVNFRAKHVSPLEMPPFLGHEGEGKLHDQFLLSSIVLKIILISFLFVNNSLFVKLDGHFRTESNSHLKILNDQKIKGNSFLFVIDYVNKELDILTRQQVNQLLRLVPPGTLNVGFILHLSTSPFITLKDSFVFASTRLIYLKKSCL